ncbi:type II toxin-antitoxin system RelE/ParE family toxin [Saccharothrix longispora]|uniref:mRNA interferase RelE/StbE n=1 Tax=Saccharothrix longispora TaxID=33920 RepID=A0ABU1Q2Y8_9PSEU|nr:type II toxin-antitoxin system RelE/ParE family toxin [Saccharothrix longispora]MDR6597251.1 mRNA interferase RelE/StbE [Saccharothrix longispora]
MSYEIEWAASALRELRKLDKQVGRRIALAVTALGTDPRPPGCRALTGRPAGVMRIRVGDHRVVYRIEDAKVLVTVVRVAHRREAYRRT